MDAQSEEEERDQRLDEIIGAYLEFADAGCAPQRDELLDHGDPRFPREVDFCGDSFQLFTADLASIALLR